MGLKVLRQKQRCDFFFFTSIHILTAKVPPIEKHQLDLVAFVERDEEDE